MAKRQAAKSAEVSALAQTNPYYAEKTVDAVVAEVFSAPEPVDVPETEVECFLREAREAQAVYSAGNAVSPEVLKVLVNRAVALLSRG